MQITPVQHTMQKNNQNFGGKVYSKQTLDKYINILGEYRKAGSILQRKMQVVTEATQTKLNETNNLIKPLLKDDEDFLWAITPVRTKDQFARIVATSNYTNIDSSTPINESTNTWNKVMEMIRNRIIKEHPEKLTKEFKEIEPSIKDTTHIEKLKNLKGLLYKKQNHIQRLEDRKEDLAMSHYDTISKIELDLIKTIPFADKSNTQAKTFLRELYHRVVEKQPELKQIYKNSYKKFFNNNKKSGELKLGQLKQEASVYGHIKVKDFLKYGTANSSEIHF